MNLREQTIGLIKQLVIRAYVDGMMAVSEPNVVFCSGLHVTQTF